MELRWTTAGIRLFWQIGCDIFTGPRSFGMFAIHMHHIQCWCNFLFNFHLFGHCRQKTIHTVGIRVRLTNCAGMLLCPIYWARPVVTKQFAYGMFEPVNAPPQSIQKAKISTSRGHRMETQLPLAIRRIWWHSSIRAHIKSEPKSNSILKWMKSPGTIPAIYSFWQMVKDASMFSATRIWSYSTC